MKSLCAIIFFIFCFFAFPCYSAEVILSWNVSEGATGYKIYQSVDLGELWTEVADVTETQVVLSNVPDSGIVLFRASAYNSAGEAIRTEAGAWYNGSWKVSEKAKKLGIE